MHLLHGPLNSSNCFCVIFLSPSLSSCSMASSFRKNYVLADHSSNSAWQLLCSWDFSITNETAVRRRTNNLCVQLKVSSHTTHCYKPNQSRQEVRKEKFVFATIKKSKGSYYTFNTIITTSLTDGVYSYILETICSLGGYHYSKLSVVNSFFRTHHTIHYFLSPCLSPCHLSRSLCQRKPRRSC